MPGHKTCIIIVGPTASGKTDLSLKIAERFHTAIISADSRQCYKELNIGVAKPAVEDLQRTRHYFINTHSIHDEVNAGIFETYALNAAKEIFLNKDIAVMAGGTGLYVKAFCNGIDSMPEVDETIRAHVRKEYESRGMEWLQQMIKEHDPLFHEEGELRNPRRMLRALEIKLSSGKSILELHSSPRARRDFNILKIGIELSREEVYFNINKRVETMMGDDLLEEAKGLYEYRKLNALQTVGYTELFSYIDGACTLDKAVEEIKKNTRRYAKRQLTWFRRDENINWFSPLNTTALWDFISNSIQQQAAYNK
ncbi:MAG: tRNA (adenosine(37)-N6)-dimethylallyltransferase MiaA [Chitinophagaceae bacterium]|nr:tRNA (adenosine(37)-N6)-dimethylallyltransferase MiaA [Chitinophagaceae bacterium]